MKKSVNETIRVYELSLPEYRLETTPDYARIGKKIDALIMRHFHGKWIAIRGISMQDHPGKTVNEMIAIIKKLGTDRYDPERKEVHHDTYAKFNVELHATPIIAKEKVYSGHYTEDRCTMGSVGAEIIKDLYEGALIDRGYSLRIDLFLIYDLDKLRAAPMRWEGDGPIHVEEPIAPQDTCGYQFKDPKNKPDALLGIIKLT